MIEITTEGVRSRGEVIQIVRLFSMLREKFIETRSSLDLLIDRRDDFFESG